MTYDIIYTYQRGTMKFEGCSAPLPITELYQDAMNDWCDICGPLKSIQVLFHEIEKGAAGK